MHIALRVSLKFFQAALAAKVEGRPFIRRRARGPSRINGHMTDGVDEGTLGRWRGILLWIVLKSLSAVFAAEVIGLSVMKDGSSRPRRVDRHMTHRVYFGSCIRNQVQ